MDTQVTVNTEQGLYVIPCGEGYSCLGFDHACKYADFAHVAEPNPALKGTLDGYKEYQRCLTAAQKFAERTQTRCLAFLSPQLIGLEGRRVEVTAYGDTYRFYVGKSTGWSPIHLEIKTRRSVGGMAACQHYDTVRVIR